MAGEQGSALGSNTAVIAVAVGGGVLAVVAAFGITSALTAPPNSGNDSSVVNYGDTQQ